MSTTRVFLLASALARLIEKERGGDRRWCIIERWAACTPWPWGSDEALGYRHAKAGHDVDDLAARRGFGLLLRQSPSMEVAANQGFVAHHRHLAQ
jgi:hypothetical protein